MEKLEILDELRSSHAGHETGGFYVLPPGREVRIVDGNVRWGLHIELA